jgi:hypothetical protein
MTAIVREPASKCKMQNAKCKMQNEEARGAHWVRGGSGAARFAACASM